MRSRSDVSPTHRPHPISRAELARRAGKAKSTITELLQGPLAAICLGSGRIDAAHPALAAWARDVWRIDPAVLVGGRASAAPTYDALVPLDAFAALAGEPASVVARATHVGGELAAASFGGRIDLTHAAALRYLAARPFPRRRGHAVIDGFPLADACVGDAVDLAHPVCVAFLARCWGRVPSLGDLEAVPGGT